MTSKLLRRLAPLALAALLLAASAQPAAAARSYCSPSGDLCYGALRGSPVKLRITLAARYFSSYRLCVTGPDGARDCKRFRVREGKRGIYASTVRWARHFPNRGRGRYKVRWLNGSDPLGPAVSFRR